jgi:hypothetical protein
MPLKGHKNGQKTRDSNPCHSLIMTDIPELAINRAIPTHEFELKYHNKEKKKTLEEMIPVELHEYLNIFSKTATSRFPTEKPWDHKIEMKEGFVLKSFKAYSLTPEEERLMKEFVDEI